MFVEFIYIYIYIHIYKQYNLETTRRNTSKLKYFISIKKTKYLSKTKLKNLSESAVLNKRKRETKPNSNKKKKKIISQLHLKMSQ
jgi:hypothetical protein